MKRRKKIKPAPTPFPLRALLNRHGWSQRRLAAASGIDEQRISDLANGRHSPTWRTILRIVTTIGADLGDLQPGKEGVA
jgi:transcriptional regulator with XRE-family HTH domain